MLEYHHPEPFPPTSGFVARIASIMQVPEPHILACAFLCVTALEICLMDLLWHANTPPQVALLTQMPD